MLSPSPASIIPLVHEDFKGLLRVAKFLIHQAHLSLRCYPVSEELLKKVPKSKCHCWVPYKHLQEGQTGDKRRSSTSVSKRSLRRYKRACSAVGMAGYLRTNPSPHPQRAGRDLGKGDTLYKTDHQVPAWSGHFCTVMSKSSCSEPDLTWNLFLYLLCNREHVV